MILINEQWYEVRDLDDIVTIIKEQFNYDLSDKMDELIKEVEFDEDYKVKDLLLDISNLEDDVSNKDYEINELQKEIEELQMELDSKDSEIEHLNQEIESLNEQIEYWSSEVCGKEE